MLDSFRFTQLSLLLLITLLLHGCSRGGGDQPEVGLVTGRVTIGGEALSGAIVCFMPDTGRAATGLTDQDGHYKLTYIEGVDGCKLGPNTVIFMPPTGGKLSHPIPAQYQQDSPLKVEVAKGQNTFDFDLEPDKSKKTPGRAPAVAPD